MSDSRSNPPPRRRREPPRPRASRTGPATTPARPPSPQCSPATLACRERSDQPFRAFDHVTKRVRALGGILPGAVGSPSPATIARHDRQCYRSSIKTVANRSAGQGERAHETRSRPCRGSIVASMKIPAPSRGGASGGVRRLRAELASASRFLALSLAVIAATALAARAEIPGDKIRLGVLSDFSGPFADQVGKGSFVAAQMAAEDFSAKNREISVEVIFADHQNKPDIGVAIARRWIDEEGVAAIVDLANSGVGLAVNTLMHDRNRAMMASATATSDLTGKFCQPTTVAMGARHLGARPRGRPRDHRRGRAHLVLHQFRLRPRQGVAARRRRSRPRGRRKRARFGLASARGRRFRLLSVAGRRPRARK